MSRQYVLRFGAWEQLTVFVLINSLCARCMGEVGVCVCVRSCMCEFPGDQISVKRGLHTHTHTHAHIHKNTTPSQVSWQNKTVSPSFP